MAYKITEDCLICGACEAECPNQAISMVGERYVIDPEKCTECVGFYPSSHCADVCPAAACIPDPEHRETKEQLLAKFKRLHPDLEPKLF